MPKRHAIVAVKDVNQQHFVRRLAHYLKKHKKVELPEWVDYVKTGYAKELPPNHQDWLYVRMASVLRRVYMRCPSGVGALARRYGSLNKRRGVRPNHTAQGGRKIIRYSLQQFEKLGWVRKAERGRKLTKAGRIFMDEFCGRCRRSPMVIAYWKRRQKQERLAKRLKRRQQQESAAGGTAGGGAENGTAGQGTAGGDAEYDEAAMGGDDQYAQQPAQNVEVQHEYD